MAGEETTGGRGVGEDRGPVPEVPTADPADRGPTAIPADPARDADTAAAGAAEDGTATDAANPADPTGRAPTTSPADPTDGAPTTISADPADPTDRKPTAIPADPARDADTASAGAAEDGAATDAANSADALAVAFGRLLRAAGLSVPIGSVLTFASALGAVGLTERDAVYWAARSTLVRRTEDFPLFDRAFAVFWEHRGVEVPLFHDEVTSIALAVDTEDEDGDGDGNAEAGDDPSIALRFSAVESLRHKDFATYTHDELHEAQRLMADLRLVGAPRRSRRLVTAKPGRRPHRGRPDLRRTIQVALRAGGEPISVRYRQPGERLRRLVLLLDISGSMEPYARALLRFVQAAVAGRQRVEAFALGTRLTRVTRELSSHDPDHALSRASDRVQDWSGGTRLGTCIRAFNDQWGVRGMARGAIVVVLSDGWDRGEPEVLAEQMNRLHRVAHKVVWVNPLKVTPGYAPLARGMAAALPYVDDFVEGHSVHALEELAEVISR